MAKIYIDISDYKPWSSAVDTYDRIEREGKLDELEALVEELYPDGISDTGLNDLLWFDSDFVLENLGIRTESQIQDDIDEKEEELEEKREELRDFMEDYEADCEDLPEDERAKVWEDDYADAAKNLEEDIAFIENELDELREELEEV